MKIFLVFFLISTLSVSKAEDFEGECRTHKHGSLYLKQHNGLWTGRADLYNMRGKPGDLEVNFMFNAPKPRKNGGYKCNKKRFVKSQVRTIATLQLHDNGTINESGFEYDTGIQLDVPMSMINGEGIMFQTKKNWKIVDCCVVVVKKLKYNYAKCEFEKETSNEDERTAGFYFRESTWNTTIWKENKGEQERLILTNFSWLLGRGKKKDMKIYLNENVCPSNFEDSKTNGTYLATIHMKANNKKLIGNAKVLQIEWKIDENANMPSNMPLDEWIGKSMVLTNKKSSFCCNVQTHDDEFNEHFIKSSMNYH